MEYSTQGQTAGGTYAQLQSARSTFDREAKESSKLTIPSLIPESTTGTRALSLNILTQATIIKPKSKGSVGSAISIPMGL